MSLIQRVYFSKERGFIHVSRLLKSQLDGSGFDGSGVKSTHHPLLTNLLSITKLYKTRPECSFLLSFEPNRLMRRLLAIKPRRSYHGCCHWLCGLMGALGRTLMGLQRTAVVLKLRRRAARATFSSRLGFRRAGEEASASPTGRRGHLRGYR